MKPRIGISACVLGRPVRFDGGHKRNRFLTDRLAEHVEYLPVCPEVELGLGTPRPTIRLQKDDGGETRLLMPKTGEDLTERMRRLAAARVDALAEMELDGFVLQGRSPSCGMKGVKVYGANGMPHSGNGSGLFAEELQRRLPGLPVEESGRLNDALLRENFVARVFASQRLRACFQPGWTRGDLVRFHAAEKMALLARGRAAYAELGRLVGRQHELPREELETRYRALFLEGMAGLPRRGRVLDAIQHLFGHFREVLPPAERRHALEVQRDFERGLVSLAVPIRLLRWLASRFEREWVARQTFLRPAPANLGLHDLIP